MALDRVLDRARALVLSRESEGLVCGLHVQLDHAPSLHRALVGDTKWDSRTTNDRVVLTL
jgi:hypothetical protein